MEIIKSLKHKIKKGILVGSMIIPSFFGKINLAYTSEDLKDWFFSPPWVQIEYNTGKNKHLSQLPTYSKSYSQFFYDGGIPLWVSSLKGLNTNESFSKMSSFIQQFYYGKNLSYQDFVEKSKQLPSYEEKLSLAAAIASFSSNFGYDSEGVLGVGKFQNNLLSQEEFFQKFSNSLSTQAENLIGRCSKIHTYSEIFLRDIGFDSVATIGGPVLTRDASRGGHAYNLVKFEDKLAIIDYQDLYILNTKNVQKALEVYQRTDGITAFSYLFFENSKLKYNPITKDGENYLNFVGYDGSLNSFRENFSEYKLSSEPFVKVSATQNDHETSGELNFFGLFFKGGNVTGDSFSPLEKMTLYEGGIKKGFVFPLEKLFFGKFYFGLIGGKLLGKNNLQEKILGHTLNLDLYTNRKEGFNLGIGIHQNFLDSYGSSLPVFENSSYNFGLSYSEKIMQFKIKPYLAVQYQTLMVNLSPELKETLYQGMEGGLNFSFNLDSSSYLFVDPYYTEKNLENGFGVKLGFNQKNLQITFGGYDLNSKYWANPNKRGLEFKIGWDFRYFDGEISSKHEILDYDGEKYWEDNLGFKLGIKY